MIRFTRSARIVHGKFPQAIQWAKEITEFANKKYKIQMNVYMDTFGEYGRIRWFADYADLSAFEKVMNQVMADQEYWQKVAQASDFIMQGSVNDIVMRAI